MDSKSILKRNIKRACKEASEEIAKISIERLKEMSTSAMMRFYADYDPHWYKRTYSFFKARDEYKKVASFNAGTSGVSEFGIRISSDRIGHPYRAYDTAWVFRRTYELGIHGFTSVEYRKIKWAKVEKTLKNGEKKEWSFRPNSDYTDPDKYGIPHRYRNKNTDTEKAFSPKIDMDRAFKEFKKKELPDLAKQCLTRAMQNNI